MFMKWLTTRLSMSGTMFTRSRISRAFFKRALKGTYVSVEPFHLDAYVKEQTFRFNERKKTDGSRFREVLGAVAASGPTRS